MDSKELESRDFLEYRILSRKLKEFKDANDLTYETIAKSINVDKSHVLRVGKMETWPSLKFITGLAHYMKIPLYFLFIPYLKKA